MHRTKGLILRKYSFKDADRLIILYTERYGKKELLAKGSKKIKSRLAGHLVEFAEIDVDFIYGKNHEKIIGAQIRKNFCNLKSDLKRIALGSFVIDVANNLLKWDYPDVEIYKLLLQVLNVIDSESDLKKAYLLSYVFGWKLLNILGHQPILDRCAKCGKKLQGNCFFKAEGVLCSHCALDEKKSLMITENMLKFLTGQKGALASHNEIISITGSFMRHHLEKILKSEIWLDKLFVT